MIVFKSGFAVFYAVKKRPLFLYCMAWVISQP